jgi:glycosyltransferase involved in cell wall biosynthesis
MSLYMKNEYIKENSIKNKIKSYINYIWAKNYEKKYYSKAKNIIMITKKDASYVKNNCPNSKVWVVQNGVDTEYFRKSEIITQSGNVLIFTGVMDYSPNSEAAIHLIREILPIIKKNVYDINVLIVGKNPTEELKRIAKKDKCVTITGYVEDLRPYFNKAKIYVAPILSGAGMKNKILEAWSMSLPVVATKTACDGIDIEDGENVIIANDEKKFANDVIRLINDSKMREILSYNGRARAEERYSWKSMSCYLENVFLEVLQSNSVRNQIS